MPRLVPITTVIMISYEAITQPLITHSFSNIEIVLKSVSTTCPSKGQAQNWAKYQISAEYWGQSWPSVHLELTLLYIVWLFFLMSSIYFFHAWTIIFIKITHTNLASHPQKKKKLRQVGILHWTSKWFPSFLNSSCYLIVIWWYSHQSPVTTALRDHCDPPCLSFKSFWQSWLFPSIRLPSLHPTL